MLNTTVNTISTNNSNHEQSHKLQDLAALVCSDVNEGCVNGSQTLRAEVWRDGELTITFPNGRKLHAHAAPGMSLDAVIEIAVTEVQLYTRLVCGFAAPLKKIWINKVPLDLTTDSEILGWMSVCEDSPSPSIMETGPEPPTVITVRHSVHMSEVQENIEELASCSCGGGAHVYLVPASLTQGGQVFVISGVPLTPDEVIQHYERDQGESARQALKKGVDPNRISRRHGICHDCVSRIAQEEGLTLPPDWFAEWKQDATRTGKAKPSEACAV